jgi:putative transposase
MPRRTLYYQPIKTAPKVNETMATRIKAFIEKYPEAGYRTVAWMLNYNKNTVQRIFQLKGWQVNKKPRGFRPRVKAFPSAVPEPDTRWSTDLARVWCGKDRWCTLAVVMDCGSRELLGWQLSRSAKAQTAESALEHALINRFGCLGRVPKKFKLRSDNGLVFCSKSYIRLVKAYGLEQEFITPHTPQQNGMVERLIRTIKEQCVYHHRFESIGHARRVIAEWIDFYNKERPHQSLGMKSPEEWYRLAA